MKCYNINHGHFKTSLRLCLYKDKLKILFYDDKFVYTIHKSYFTDFKSKLLVKIYNAEQRAKVDIYCLFALTSIHENESLNRLRIFIKTKKGKQINSKLNGHNIRYLNDRKVSVNTLSVKRSTVYLIFTNKFELTV